MSALAGIKLVTVKLALERRRGRHPPASTRATSDARDPTLWLRARRAPCRRELMCFALAFRDEPGHLASTIDLGDLRGTPNLSCTCSVLPGARRILLG